MDPLLSHVFHVGHTILACCPISKFFYRYLSCYYAFFFFLHMKPTTDNLVGHILKENTGTSSYNVL